MRAEALQHSRKCLKQAPTKPEASPNGCPQFARLLPLFSPFCPLSGLSRCLDLAGVVPMLLAYQDREEGRSGGPFAPVVRSSGPQALRLPRGPRESEQDRGTEAQHHPTKRGTQQDQLPRCSRSCRSAPDGASKERKPTRIEETQQAKEPKQVRNERKAKKRSDNKPTSLQKGYPPRRQG